MYNNHQGFNQMPPTVDAYGRPMMTFPVMTYEQQILYRQDLIRQQREYLKKRLEEKYPSKLVFVYGILMILIGIAEIVLQIISIIFDGGFAYIAHGIWGGSFLILLAILAISLIKWRSVGLFTASMLIHSIGITAVVMSLIFINALSFMSYDKPNSSRYSKSTTNESAIANKNMIPVTGIMLGLGVLSTILVTAYLICLCRVNSNRVKHFPLNSPMGLQTTHQIGSYSQAYPPPYNVSNNRAFLNQIA